MKATIRAAFESRLNAWAKAQVPPLQIAWENVPFTPPAAAYLQPFVIPANTTNESLSGDLTEFTGLYQVNIVCPEGGGPGGPEKVAKGVIDLFPAATRITQGAASILILAPMSERPPIQGAGKYTIPLSCTYKAHKT